MPDHILGFVTVFPIYLTALCSTMSKVEERPVTQYVLVYRHKKKGACCGGSHVIEMLKQNTKYSVTIQLQDDLCADPRRHDALLAESLSKDLVALI